MATSIARVLLEAGALRINGREWFTYSNGFRSPVLCDLLMLFHDTRARKVVTRALAAETKQLMRARREHLDIILAADIPSIPWATLLAEELRRPLAFVHESHNGPGKTEGRLHAGQHALLVDEIVTSCHTVLRATDVLRQSHLHVIGGVSVFDFDFTSSVSAFAQEHFPMRTLTTLSKIMEEAADNHVFSPNEITDVLAWHHHHSGDGSL